ncbi:ABC1-domain-containing protein [Choiromyces venosus 120613-1]|uniref:ABC1-domain-containing protein n=1 Tax=Choiromyces venosus 120613-1 TaxID=1336337 RepID=A0A3N4KGU7_9PEZI|nr:ABC1-domain-containing protein [Choiromyces venosus 120613-1]
MRALSFPRVLFRNNVPWTCRRCLSTLKVYSRRPGRGGKILMGAAAGTALGAVTFGAPDVGHSVAAIERASRVASTLALCINDYRVTLKYLELDPDDGDGRLAKCHKRCAERTYKVLEKNGSVFIKLGQHLAAMGYLLPAEWTDTFIPLQDQCPVSSFESIEKMILDDTGQSISDLFSEFDPNPIGAGTVKPFLLIITVMGKGLIKCFRVAVKLQHPALAEWIPLDMALTRFTFTNIKYFFPEYPMTWLSDEMEASLPQELNFETEAKNIIRVREYFKGVKNTPLVIPNVIWAKPRILVMEYLPGHRLDDLAFLDSNGVSREEVSAALSRIFNEMVFGKNAPLHCDPHGGNLAIRLADPNINNRSWIKKIFGRRRKTNFEIILYDHGLYRDIPMQMRRSYAKLWLAVIDGDETRMRRYANEVAGITDEQFPLFASAITGRDYTALQRGVASPRDENEKEIITGALGEGLLAQLIQLLANVPSVILLILKTNDLTRSLDENLQAGTGPERQFLILARYCARAVYEEALEMGGWKILIATVEYWRISLKLQVFEWGVWWRGVYLATTSGGRRLLEGRSSSSSVIGGSLVTVK